MKERKIEEAVFQKAGGRYKLSTLMQKRIRELQAGAHRLVKTDSTDLYGIALEEIRRGRVTLELPPQDADVLGEKTLSDDAEEE